MQQPCESTVVVARAKTNNKKQKSQTQKTNNPNSFLPSLRPPAPPQALSLAPDPQCNSRRLVSSLLLVYNKQKTHPPVNGLHNSRVFAAAAVAAATAAAGCR
jgi:hypothetical protein